VLSVINTVVDEGGKVWKLNDPWSRRSIWETLVSASDCETGARGQQMTRLKFATLFNSQEEQPQRGHCHHTPSLSVWAKQSRVKIRWTKF